MADELLAVTLPRPLSLGIAWVCLLSWSLSPFGVTRPAWAQNEEREAGDAEPGEADQDPPAEEPAPPADTGLPPGYKPPAERPDAILLEKNLMTPEEQTEFKKKYRREFFERVRGGDLRTDETKELVRNGIRYLLNELTLKENRRDLPRIRELLTSQLLRRAGMIGGLKPDQLREFRAQLLSMITQETSQLFDNNLHVRIQAAILLGELNLIEDDEPAKGLKREAYAPAAGPLVDVLRDPEQFQGVKVASVLSLIRILRKGNPSVELKRDIANALISELKRDPETTHPWYQARLAQALGSVDQPFDLERQPFVYNALDSVLNDPKRALQVRAEAAWSLGRHPVVPGVNVQKLADDVARVGLDLAKAYDKAPGDPSTTRAAWTLYLAFQRKDDEDVDVTRQHKGGLLNLNPPPPPAAAAEIKAAYEQLLPIVVPILSGNQIAPEQVQALDKWLETRSPKPNNQPVGKAGNGGNVSAAVRGMP